MEPTQGHQKCESHSTFRGGTGTLDELVGSHTDTAEVEGLWLVNGPKCLVQ